MFVGKSGGYLGIADVALRNMTTFFIPIAAIWVYFFAINIGIVSRLLSSKFSFG